MQHIFLTQANVISPRWQQAFPLAKIIDNTDDLPLSFNDVMLWVLLDHAQLKKNIAMWVAAGARIVGLAKIESSDQAKLTMESGASGYLHYLAAEPVLLQVSQVVQLGGLWLGADLLRQLVFATANTVTTTQAASLLHSLTLREKSVAEAVAAGKTNKEVARELDITERTVKAHLSAVFEKLDVRDRLHLVLVMSGK
ncbi:MAG: response regulator transcription factor [Pseudomonadota bacterium]